MGRLTGKRRGIAGIAGKFRSWRFPAQSAPVVPGDADCATRLVEGLVDPAFPVDLVYTWVDHADAAFRATMEQYAAETGRLLPAAADASRFEDHDELRFSLRSIELFAPWVRRIHIVTNGQVPDWLRTDHEKIRLVDHRQILPESALPTFNSHAIEASLHRIDGLAEHYVYFNDDVLLARPASKLAFFTENGLAKIFAGARTLPDNGAGDEETATIRAARNARTLIEGVWPAALPTLFEHTFHPQRRSVAEDVERRFAQAMDHCRHHRFRDPRDLLVAGYLNHNACFFEGKGIVTRTDCAYFNVRRRMAPRMYRELLAKRGTDAAPQSICINDDAFAAPERDFVRDLGEFLNAYFPTPSAFERTGL